MTLPLDPETPYGHTIETARREPRLKVSVTIREGHMGQALSDGRAYPSGTHEIQIYKSDLPALTRLLETKEHRLAEAREYLAEREAEWYEQNNTSKPGECPYNLMGAFRELVRRDLLPVTKIEVISEMDPIAIDHARAHTRMVAETASATQSSAPTHADIAAIVAQALKQAGVGDVSTKGGRS